MCSENLYFCRRKFDNGRSMLQPSPTILGIKIQIFPEKSTEDNGSYSVKTFSSNPYTLDFSQLCYWKILPNTTPCKVEGDTFMIIYLHFRCFLLLWTWEKFWKPLFSQTVAVTYESVIPAAVLNTALLCVKNEYFIAKNGTLLIKYKYKDWIPLVCFS